MTDSTAAEFAHFSAISVYDDADEKDYWTRLYGKAAPNPPPLPETIEKHLDFEQYLKDKCENRIKCLERQNFHAIKRPMVIGFNYFHEYCNFYVKYLDIFHQLALNYGDRIEFVLGDIMDIDVIYPGRNPASFFCLLSEMKHQSLLTFAIDEKHQIYEHYDCEQSLETYTHLCDNLLSGALFKSQPLPEAKEGGKDSLVKICVHHNYDELVANCQRDVFLILYVCDYEEILEGEPDYEQVARAVKDLQVDVVYMNGMENHVPLHLNVNAYPTYIFISGKDKSSTMHCPAFQRSTERLIDFISKQMGPEGAALRQQAIQKTQYKPLSLPEHSNFTLETFESYLNEKFPDCLKVLHRESLKTNKNACLIYFMDLENRNINFYFKYLKDLYQVAECKITYDFDYWIADIRHMAVIYPQWFEQYIRQPCESLAAPKIFARDRHLRWHELQQPFCSPTAISVCLFDLSYGRLFTSQPWAFTNNGEVVQNCVGHNLELLLRKSKKNVFLTLYWSTYKAAHKVLQLLQDMVEEVEALDVKMMKIDAKHNYIPLEFKCAKYPQHFFIPCQERAKETRRFEGQQTENKEALMEFIRRNIERQQSGKN